MDKSKIQWCDATWNPVMGCTRVSTGCKNCYALKMIHRRAGRKGWPAAPEEVTLFPERLEQPAHWKKPRRIFVCSMADLFHEDVPFEFIEQVWRVMHVCQQHTFMVLTKRHERMFEFHTWLVKRLGNYKPPRHIGLGATIENQEQANKRTRILLDIPAGMHFLNVEPMLESIDLVQSIFFPDVWRKTHPSHDYILHPTLRGSGIDWVICGAESGTQRRPFQMEWARQLKNQCLAAGIPFFFKQAQQLDGRLVETPELDGRTWLEFPKGEYKHEHFNV